MPLFLPISRTKRLPKKEFTTDYQIFTKIFSRFLFYFFSFLPSFNSYLRYVRPPLDANSFPTILLCSALYHYIQILRHSHTNAPLPRIFIQICKYTAFFSISRSFSKFSSKKIIAPLRRMAETYVLNAYHSIDYPDLRPRPFISAPHPPHKKGGSSPPYTPRCFSMVLMWAAPAHKKRSQTYDGLSLP